MTDYMRMVAACTERDRQGVIDMSVKLGFLTGREGPAGLERLLQPALLLGPYAPPY